MPIVAGPIVAGVDFGTLSVRVTLLDSDARRRKGADVSPPPSPNIRSTAAAKTPTTPRNRTTTR